MNTSLISAKLLGLLVGFIFIINMAACNMSSASAEPITWIDQPLNNSQFPLSSIIIQAHAADADGIASIEFLIFDDLIASVSTGGTRLENASLEWKPKKSGTYTINVRAIDTQGNTNARSMAKVDITIGSENTPTDTVLPTESNTPSPMESNTPSPTESNTPSPLNTQTPTAAYTDTPGPNIYKESTITLTTFSGPTFMLDQNANCRRGPSTVFDSVDVISQGTTVFIEGRNADNSWFWVQKPSGNANCWVSSVTGTTNGNLQVLKVIATPSLPITATPTFQVLEILPIDTSPPSISNVSISPSTVMQQGCGSPDTFTISATVTDASGVANVIYEILGPTPDRWGEHYLLPVGGDIYQAVIGPYNNSVGTWTITIHAKDMNQISSQAGPWTVQFVCIQ